MPKIGGESSGIAMKRVISVGLAAVFILGVFTIMPNGSQIAEAWMSPGGGMMLTLADIELMSGGFAVQNAGPGMWAIHETLIIMPGDTLMIEPGQIINVDPFMGITIEIMGSLDAGFAMGTIFMGGGPGSWEGFWVHDSGSFMANGLMIQDAVNGIFIDHSFGFGMVQITGCQIFGCISTGITMIGTMGGPMVDGNMIQGCDTGIYLKDTSAQCFSDTVMDCNYGIIVEGDFSPNINSCQIHDNYYCGVLLRYANSPGIMSCTFSNNYLNNVHLFHSSGFVSDNKIFARNATAGSNEPGRVGVLINGTVEWGQAWISQNWIYGGNGDENQPGGNAIEIVSYVGNASNGWVDNIEIENNHVISGGNGGVNNLPDGLAGNGGCGIMVLDLPNEEDYLADQQSLIIRENDGIFGGRGGDNLFPASGFEGNGGSGIEVSNPDGLGNIRVQGNVQIAGGDDGDPGFSFGENIESKPCGIAYEDVDGVGSSIEDNGLVLPGLSTPGLPELPFFFKGYGIRLERCSNIEVWNLSGNSETFLVFENNSSNTTFSHISIQDSDANSGGLIRAENSTGGGNNQNWDFGGKDGLTGVVLRNCSGWNIANLSLHTENATAMVIEASTGINLDQCQINVTNGNGILADDTPFLRVNGTSIGIEITGQTLQGNFAFKQENTKTPESKKLENCTLNVTGATGIVVSQTSNFIVTRSQVMANDGQAFLVEGSEDLGFEGFEVEQPCLPTGAFPSNPCRDSDNVTVRNSTMKTVNAIPLDAKNCTGLLLVDSFFDVEYNITGVNSTGLNITGSKGTRIQNCTVETVNATGLRAVNCNGTFVIDSFFDITCQLGVSEGSSGVVVADSVEADFEEIRMVLNNATGVNATNTTGLRISKLNLSIPHQGYKGHGVRLKAIARSGVHNSVINVSSGAPLFRWDLFMEDTKNCTVINVSIKGTGGGGIQLVNSRYNIVRGNTVEGKDEGIKLIDSTDNSIYHNNLLGNLLQAWDDRDQNAWDDGYPSGGNYWSDYGGLDLLSGALQDQPGSDGIGDTPYIIDADSFDRYPLMSPMQYVQHTTNLVAGWNLISVPMRQLNTSIHEVLASIDGYWDQVNIYDPVGPEHWLSYNTAKPPALNELWDLDRTMGIWVHTTQACTFTSYGTEVASTGILLRAGWNLVGFPTLEAVDANTVLLGTGWDSLQCFDGTEPYLLRDMLGTDMMEPGHGYWVHVPADVVWTVNW